MNFKDLIENYDNYKNAFKNRKKIIIMWRRYSNNLEGLFSLPIIMFFIGFLLSAHLISNFGFLGMIPFLIFSLNIEKIFNFYSYTVIEKDKNISSLLKKLWKKKFVLTKNKRRKLSKKIDIKFNKEDQQYCTQLVDKIHEFEKYEKEKYIKKFKSQHSFLNIFIPKSVINIDAKQANLDRCVKMEHILNYCLENATVEELESVDKNKLKMALSDFPIEEQIRITEHIKSLLEEKNNKENQLKENFNNIKKFSNKDISIKKTQTINKI